MTFSAGGTCSAIAALVSPIRGRRSKMSTSPRRSPSTSTVPSVGAVSLADNWSRVVLPAPFGPIRIQRSSPCAVQSTLRSRTAASRRTSTPRSRSTSSDIRLPFSAPPPRPNLCHSTPLSPARSTVRPANLADRPEISPNETRPGWIAYYMVVHARRERRLALFVPDRDQGGLGAVLHAELGQHGTHVRLHRLLRDGQGPGDLPVGPALGDLGQHLALPAGERVQAVHRVPAAAVADQGAGRLRRKQQVPVVHRADRPDQGVRVDVLVHHPGR